MADVTSANPVTFIWLFPAVYLLHIAEEHWGGGGFSAYLARTRGVELSPLKFLVMNAVGWSLMTAGLLLALRLKFAEWMMVCLATVVFINGLAHTINAVLRAEYNPGLVTGLLLFIPLGASVLARLKGRMRGHRYFGALMVGAFIHVVIFWLALSGGKLGLK
ncbi:MAG TPA: HXXEE domain-containing protein [Pyrinomonadaceae bacterium]|jgi:hypothetical protein